MLDVFGGRLFFVRGFWSGEFRDLLLAMAGGVYGFASNGGLILDSS